MTPEPTQQLLKEANEGIELLLNEREVDDYAAALARAQRKLGYREIVLSEGEF